MGSVKLVLFCLLFSCISFVVADEIQIKVKTTTSIAKIDDDFICATLDYWPSTKCDYDQCPWGKAGIFNLDLKNKILANAVKAFNSLRLRIGGSLQDQVIYKVGKVRKCPHFKNRKQGHYGFSRFGFSHGCITMDRWDELHQFFSKTGAKVTFSFNALKGKWAAKHGGGAKNDSILYIGKWHSYNARDLMEYTISKGYKIDSYELGNELCGTGVSVRVEAEQYAKDMIVLKNLVKELYPNGSRPMVLGPGGFYEEDWFNTFLQVSGPGVIDGLTHHIYNLGPGNDADLINKIQDPYFLNNVAETYKDVASSVKNFGPWTAPWVGEAGGAYNSGGKNISHTFADGFWYLDQLGMTSTFGHKVFCRQALVGGNYGLLNKTFFVPNPDYYGALLWHRLMGTKVLSVSHDGSPYLRSYAHCTKNSSDVTVFLINMSNSTTFEVRVINDLNLFPSLRVAMTEREEYHLTPEGGDIQSDVVLLNGTPLKLTKSFDIPKMNPELVDPTLPITVGPDSFVFATLKGVDAPACANS